MFQAALKASTTSDKLITDSESHDLKTTHAPPENQEQRSEPLVCPQAGL